MSESHQYHFTDCNGDTHSVEVTPDDTQTAYRQAVKNMAVWDPDRVLIECVRPQEDELRRLQVTVKAPSHYLTSDTDTTPKPCNETTFLVAVYPGYPGQPVRAWYPANHRLASVNVFRSGSACIDTWHLGESSLDSTVEKLVLDIIHCPAVCRDESPACSDLIPWYQENVAAGRFPTMDPRLLCRSAPTLPVRAQPVHSASGLPVCAMPARPPHLPSRF